MHTFIDSSGSFPGMGHCVQGIQGAPPGAGGNIRVADLPTFMREYCEEDIATALGTTLPQDEVRALSGVRRTESTAAITLPSS